MHSPLFPASVLPWPPAVSGARPSHAFERPTTDRTARHPSPLNPPDTPAPLPRSSSKSAASRDLPPQPPVPPARSEERGDSSIPPEPLSRAGLARQQSGREKSELQSKLRQSLARGKPPAQTAERTALFL